MLMLESVQYPIKGTQSGNGMLQYWTEICWNADAGGIDLDADASYAKGTV